MTNYHIKFENYKEEKRDWLQKLEQELERLHNKLENIIKINDLDSKYTKGW